MSSSQDWKKKDAREKVGLGVGRAKSEHPEKQGSRRRIGYKYKPKDTASKRQGGTQRQTQQ